MAVVKIQEVRKDFGNFSAVDGIDLDIGEGEFVAFLGSSGSGKSTLMRLVAGLEKPDGGDILVNGESVVGIAPRHRNIAMVFQNYALYPQMTVRANIAFPLKAHKIPKDQWSEKIEWAVSILRVEHLLDRKPTRLSGGEKQRVALARALVREPHLFLFDEPLSALDAQVRNVARAELRELQMRTRTTTIYVTHDQVEALGLGHRVAVMSHGRVRQVGTPEELYERPADLFVASFIGNPPMNLVERGERVLGVRPEHLILKERANGAGEGMTLSLGIEQLEYVGASWLAYGRENHNSGERVVAQLPHEMGHSVRGGESHEFIAEQRHVKIFDKASGRLLE